MPYPGGKGLPGIDDMEQNVTLHKEKSLLGRRSIIGGFIAAHGIMHAMLLSIPRPDGGVGNFITRGGEMPMLNSIGLGGAAAETVGAVLMLITTAGFLISALMYLRQRRGWDNWLVASSSISIASLLLFWNDWMIMGPIIGLGLMAFGLRSRMSKVVG
jgi:hypothetical protein